MRWHLLALICALLVPLISFALIEANAVSDARRDWAFAEMQTLALRNAEGVQQGLAAMRTVAQVLALSPDLATADFTAFHRAAAQVAEDRGVDVVLRNRSGAQIVATRVPAGVSPPLLPAEDPEARRAVDGGQSYLSDLYASGMSHPFMVRVVVPATVGGESGWAVEVGFTPEQVRNWLNLDGTPAGLAVEVVGGNGLVIARNLGQSDYVARGTSHDTLAPVRGLTGEWHGELLNGSIISGVYMRLPGTAWIVAVGTEDAIFEQPRRILLLRLIAVAAGLIGLAILLSGILARRIERDTAALARAAETLADGSATIGPLLPIVEFQSVSRALGAAGREIQARAYRERGLLEEVRRSRDLLRAVVDGTIDPIFARDLQGRFVLVNRAGASALGISQAEDLIGRRVGDMAPPADTKALLHWDRLLAADDAPMAIDDCVLQEATGTTRVYQVNKSAWQDNEGRTAGVVCVARDITERTAVEARLRTLQEDLARAGRLSAVAAMAAGLAHELNQPLSAATNFLAAASSLMAGAVAEDKRVFLDEAMTEASSQMMRAADIVRRLRSFIGRDELAMEEEPLAPLVAEAAQAAWHYAADPSAELNFHLDPAATAMVDQVQLQQVVANLVRNAAEALRAGSVHNEVWVCLARTPDGGSIIDVSDTGPGLDPARRERLFDVFERSGKTGGMGVGLAICRTIVAAHGGRIWAEDNPGGGAVFRFTLPPVEQGLDLDV
jgi:two-component system sensor kinase FixL